MYIFRVKGAPVKCLIVNKQSILNDVEEKNIVLRVQVHMIRLRLRLRHMFPAQTSFGRISHIGIGTFPL